MAKPAWVCEICLSLWKDKEAAQECEDRHPPLSKLSIKSAIFGAYEAHRRYWPERLIILNHGVGHMDRDTATYELKQIGSTPV
jgi:hypothetical protein